MIKVKKKGTIIFRSNSINVSKGTPASADITRRPVNIDENIIF